MKQPESFFLHHLFDLLNKSGIPYAVMRNYVSLPDTLAGSDLDILIAPEDETAVRELVFRSIERANGTAIGCASMHGFFKVFAFGRNDEAENVWWGVCIDVNAGLWFRGVGLMEMNQWVDLQRIHNGITVLEPGFGALLGVLKEVLHNNRIPQRYRADAVRAVQDDWQRLSSALAPLGKHGLALFSQMILADSSETEVARQSRRLRRALFTQAFKSSPTAWVRNRCLHQWAKVERYLHPSGVIVAVLGVDGVGKSTVIDAIKSVLDDATHGALDIEHLRPGLLPPLARLKGKPVVQIGPVLDPHGSTPSGAFGSVFRLAYLTLDYILGYWLLLRPRIAKSPTVLLFDRYCYDMALDPRRFRLGINRRVVEWFLRPIPKPDIVLCLHAEPETILARKQELPLAEIKRQLSVLRELARREPQAILVSTQDRVDAVRNRVLADLMNYFATR